MSDYCRAWVADTNDSPIPNAMTQHHVPPEDNLLVDMHLRPPTPENASDDGDDDNDSLSIGSSDLSGSWLQVSRSSPAPRPPSGTASALGSSTISDLGESDDNGWTSDAGSEQPSLSTEDNDIDRASDDLETPTVDTVDSTADPEFTAFQRSIIFPDPTTSTSASMSTSTSTVIPGTTPVPSFSNIRTERTPWDSPFGSVPAVREVVREAPFSPVEKTDCSQEGAQSKGKSSVASDDATSPPSSAPFRAKAPRTGPKRWTLVISLIAAVSLLARIAPSFGYFGLPIVFEPSNPFPADVTAPPTPPVLVPDQVVRGSPDTVVRQSTDLVLHKMSDTSKTPTPKPRPDPDAAEYRWARSMYRWSRNQRSASEVATLVDAPVKDLVVTTEQGDDRLSPATWVSTASTAVSYVVNSVLDFIWTQIDLETRLIRELYADTYYAIVTIASFSRNMFTTACADDRCNRLRHKATDGARKTVDVTYSTADNVRRQAVDVTYSAAGNVRRQAVDFAADVQRKGMETLYKARRGLDNAIERFDNAAATTRCAMEEVREYAIIKIEPPRGDVRKTTPKERAACAKRHRQSKNKARGDKRHPCCGKGKWGFGSFVRRGGRGGAQCA